jgi:hypothetical protein
VVENCKIAEWKVLEYTRELTEGEGADRWAGRPIGGADRPHMSPPRGFFFSRQFLIPNQFRKGYSRIMKCKEEGSGVNIWKNKKIYLIQILMWIFSSKKILRR